MKKVYDDTSGAAHPIYTGCITSFGDLEVCPVEELERIIKSAPCKSCELYPVPTFLLLECLDILLPFIHIMCNSSLTSGVLPASQKKAIVTPRLKKVGMDESELESFRPVTVSNLSFMSKIIEKIVARQLIRYLDEFDMLPKFQSGFRAFHSTETTLARRVVCYPIYTWLWIGARLRCWPYWMYLRRLIQSIMRSLSIV